MKFLKLTAETAMILQRHGFETECRGPIVVKGKGEMTTYFLVDENNCM
jgi:hypothetical protein